MKLSPIKKLILKITLFLKEPFELFESKRQKLFISLSMFAGIWIFLFVFGVFEFDTFRLPYRFYYTGIYSLPCLIVLLLDLFIIDDLLIKKNTAASAFIWGFWIMFWIAISNYVLTTLLFKWEEFSISNLVKNQLYTLSIGIFVTPALIILNYNYMMRKRIFKAANMGLSTFQTTDKLLLKNLITIESKYKEGRFEMDIRKILYIQSSDNYIDICFKNETSVTHKLIRTTLNAIENEVKHPALLRCHRSFIINKYTVRSINRKAGRLIANIKDINTEIPISRKYKNEVFVRLGM